VQEKGDPLKIAYPQLLRVYAMSISQSNILLIMSEEQQFKKYCNQISIIIPYCAFL